MVQGDKDRGDGGYSYMESLFAELRVFTPSVGALTSSLLGTCLFTGSCEVSIFEAVHIVCVMQCNSV